jgi:carotenoid cleavage dioxygenase
MPRDGGNGDVRWFDVEPCYVYHPLNAFDDGETIVLDVVRHPKVFDHQQRANHRSGPPKLDRWIVDLADGKVRESRLDDRGQEFPRVDKRLTGKQHRYGYAPEVGERGARGSTLRKHDFVRGTTQLHSFGDGKVLGEFVFHPSSADAVEDDGVLMGYVYDRPTDHSELAILDAHTVSQIASVKLPHRVLAGFHGNWVPSAD